MPAWDMEKLKYAFAYGADAVYVWVPMFSLRARTNTFTMDWLKDAVKYAHDRWKKIYFTTNIFAHNYKIEPFLKQFEPMVEMNPDAFIMSDPGLINLVRKKYPDVVIHLSVQANNTNWAQIDFWREIWVKRIILSREISIKEIKEIHEKVPNIELESFVHWAICMAYSWRCLLSNYMSHRDPNQWVCSHSCRWQYKLFKEETPEEERNSATWRPKDYVPVDWSYYLEERERPWKFLPVDEDEYGTYIMNSRDLCAIDYIKDLKEAWVISFKAEWRNKTINYVASVAKCYREAIDAVEAWKEYDSKALVEELVAVSNRGYTPWFLAWNLKENSQYYEENWKYQTKLFVWVVKEYDKKKKLAKIQVKNRIDIWEKLEFMNPNETWGEKLVEIVKGDGEKLDVAHGGDFDVWINTSKDPWEFAIVRKDNLEKE